MKNLGKSELDFKQKMANLNIYMKRRNLDHVIQLKVRKYFEFLHQEELNDQTEGGELLSQLSQDLKEEVLIDIYGKLLRSKKIFSLHFSDKFIKELSLHV